MLHRVELVFNLPSAGIAAGDGVLVGWDGEHGTGSVDYTAPLQVAQTAAFPGRRQGRGKGRTGHRVWSKGGGISPERAGKGVRAKGSGPKGASRLRARVTVLVPPIFGARTFGVRILDALGNAAAGDPPEITTTVSAVPPGPGACAYESFAAGAVTIIASERSR